MTNITLNTERQLYVLDHGHGYTCFGFAIARDHTNQMAARLNRPDLSFGEADFGAISCYQKYLAAVDAWGRSALNRKTYFDPGTDPAVAQALERCRKEGTKVRLIQGDTETGRTWLDEHDVVGWIGRSAGTLRVPLLIAPGADGGTAILSACLLAIVDWATGKFLFRHTRYQAPDLLIRPSENAERPWDVLHDEQIVACFQDIGKAGAYVAFMRGETVEPRIFQ